MKLLILEDNADRVAAFEKALNSCCDFKMLVWRRASELIADLPAEIGNADLISLDHDLIPEEGEADLGDGLEVALAIAKFTPNCPIILHSTNRNRVATMTRELNDTG